MSQVEESRLRLRAVEKIASLVGDLKVLMDNLSATHVRAYMSIIETKVSELKGIINVIANQ